MRITVVLTKAVATDEVAASISAAGMGYEKCGGLRVNEWPHFS